MENFKLSISPVISLGVVMLGDIIKSKQRYVGNMIHGLGIGAGIGTVAHKIDEQYPNDLPHHDLIALVSFVYAARVML
jgi:hypothetical protein